MSVSDGTSKNSKRGRSYIPRRTKPVQDAQLMSKSGLVQSREFHRRLTYESDVIQALRACRSVEEVEHVLRDTIVLSDVITIPSNSLDNYNDDDDEDDIAFSNVKDDLHYVLSQKLLLSPRIAAKALRKIVELSLRLPPFALRHMKIHNKSYRHQGSNNRDDITQSKWLLSLLIESLATSIINETKDMTSDSSLEVFSTYSIVDLLFSFAVIQTNRSRPGMSPNSSFHSFSYLARRLCQCAFNNEQFVRQAGGERICEIMWSMAILNLQDQTEFIAYLAESLEKRRDFLGKYSAQSLASLLWSFARLNHVHAGFLKSYTRRIRKQAIRDEASASDTCKTIWAVSRSLQLIEYGTYGEGRSDIFDMNEIREETRGLIFRMTRPFLIEVKSEHNEHASLKPNNAFLANLHSGQIADIYWGFTILEQDIDSTLFSVLNEKLLDKYCLSSCTVQSIARILSSFASLRVVYPPVIEELGKRFLFLVNEGEVRYFNPGVLTQMLQALVELVPGKNIASHAFFQATSKLFSSETLSSTFYENCDDYNISMITWCLAKGRSVDCELLSSLITNFFRQNIMDQCSASSASRMLWSVTMLLSLDTSCEKDEELRNLQAELFQKLSPTLLIKSLKPVDSTSAIWSMAKASYGSDLGIFDHLTEYLTSDERRMEISSAKQLSQSLWACGKMIAFEDSDEVKNDRNETNQLPYLESALKIANHLIGRSNEMSSKDIVQVIWALARLHTEQSPIIIRHFLSVVVRKSDTYSAQETSNLMWALSKVDIEDGIIEDVIDALVQRFMSPLVLKSMKAQEASNILYACAKMNFQDENIFSTMSKILMDQVDVATSQGVANAMWAHEQVGLTPPQGLMDEWAEQKLGIVTQLK